VFHLGALLQQDRPCNPRASTSLPQTQVCGLPALQPSLWDTATLTASADSLNAIVLIGAAWNQSPECGQNAGSILALSISVEALDKMGQGRI